MKTLELAALPGDVVWYYTYFGGEVGDISAGNVAMITIVSDGSIKYRIMTRIGKSKRSFEVASSEFGIEWFLSYEDARDALRMKPRQMSLFDEVQI